GVPTRGAPRHARSHRPRSATHAAAARRTHHTRLHHGRRRHTTVHESATGHPGTEPPDTNDRAAGAGRLAALPRPRRAPRGVSYAATRAPRPRNPTRGLTRNTVSARSGYAARRRPSQTAPSS